MGGGQLAANQFLMHRQRDVKLGERGVDMLQFFARGFVAGLPEQTFGSAQPGIRSRLRFSFFAAAALDRMMDVNADTAPAMRFFS